MVPIKRQLFILVFGDNLLVHLYDVEGIESRLFEEGSEAEPGILYMLEEQVEHGFDQEHNQVTLLKKAD